MSNLADQFDLLTLADAAALLHCSKAHVGKAVNGHRRRAHAHGSEIVVAMDADADRWKLAEIVRMAAPQ